MRCRGRRFIQAGAEIAGIEMHAACHFSLDLGESGGAGAKA